MPIWYCSTWCLGDELAAGGDSHWLVFYLDRGADTQQTSMASMDLPIVHSFPCNLTSAAALLAGQDQSGRKSQELLISVSGEPSSRW